MGGAKRGTITEILVTAGKIAEDVTYENLLNPLALRELAEEIDGAGDRVFIDSLVAGEVNFPARINQPAQLARPPAAEVVEGLKGKSNRVHQLVALPAVFLACDPHALAQGLPRRVRQLRIDGDRYVRHHVSKQSLTHPLAAQDGVVVLVHRPGHQPAGLGQDSGPCPGRHPDGLLAGPFPIRRQAVGPVDLSLALVLDEALLVFIVARVDEGAVGGEQLAQDVLVALDDPAHQVVGIADQDAGLVSLEVFGILEHLGGAVVLEELVEKPQEARAGETLILEHPVERRRDSGPVIEHTLFGLVKEPLRRTLVGEGVGQRMGDLQGSEPRPALIVHLASDLPSKDRLGQEIDRREGIAHPRHAAGLPDVLLHQLEKTRLLSLLGRTTQGALELHRDGQEHLFAAQGLFRIDETQELLSRANHGLELALFDGVAGLALEDGDRVAQELGGGRNVQLRSAHILEEEPWIGSKGIADQVVEALGLLLAEALVDLGAVAAHPGKDGELRPAGGIEEELVRYLVALDLLQATGEIPARPLHLGPDPGECFLDLRSGRPRPLPRRHLTLLDLVTHHRPARGAGALLHIRIEEVKGEVSLELLRTVTGNAVLLEKGTHHGLVGRHVGFEGLAVSLRQRLVALGSFFLIRQRPVGNQEKDEKCRQQQRIEPRRTHDLIISSPAWTFNSSS